VDQNFKFFQNELGITPAHHDYTMPLYMYQEAYSKACTGTYTTFNKLQQTHGDIFHPWLKRCVNRGALRSS